MKSAYQLLDWILRTSVFTACCAVGLCMATERLLAGQRPPVATPLHLLLASGTLLVYNAPRLVHQAYGLVRHPQPSDVWYRALALAGFFGTLVALQQLPSRVALASIVPGLLAFAYSLPILPRKRRLRDTAWGKTLVLAGVWTAATCLLPMLSHGSYPVQYPYELAQRFLFIFALCILFDIRDIKTDALRQITTLPLKMGLANSYRIIHISLILFALLSALQYHRLGVGARPVAAIATALSTALVAKYLQRKPSPTGYNLLADGMMLLYAAIAVYG